MIRRDRNLALASTLIVIGVLFLLDAAQVPVFRHLWKAWPLALVALGVGRLIKQRGGRSLRLRAPEQVLTWLFVGCGLVLSFTNPGSAPDRGPSTAVDASEDLTLVGEVSIPLPPGSTLEARVHGADLVIEPGADDDALVLRLLSGSSLETLESPDLASLAKVTGQTAVVVYTADPDRERPRLSLRLAAGHPVAVTIADGNLMITAMGATRFSADTSAVRAERIDGTLHGTVRNGSFSGEGIDGAVTIEASVASVRLAGIEGDSSVRSAYGDLSLEGISGAVDARASDGAVTARGVGGLRLVGDRVRLDAVAIQGPLDLDLQSSSARIIDASKGVRFRGIQANIEMSLVHDGLDLATVGGQVHLTEINGPLQLDIEDVRLGLEGASGPITVRARRSSVRLVRPQTGASLHVADGDLRLELAGFDGAVEATTERADVTLILGGTPAALAIRADPGRIEVTSASPLEVRDAAASSTLTARLGGGSTPVSISATLATVRIEP